MKLSNLLLPVCFFGLLVPSVSSAKPVCPSQNFQTFIRAFSSDENVQQSFTANPLTLIYLEAVGLDYQVKKELINPSVQGKRYFLPVYESKQWSHEIKINKKSRYRYHVTTTVDNTILHYDFKKQKRCWYLTRYKNMGI